MKIDVFYDDCSGCPVLENNGHCDILSDIKALTKKRLNELLDEVEGLMRKEEEIIEGDFSEIHSGA